jgi:hypothetical protein
MIQKKRWTHYNLLKARCKHGHEFTPENTKVDMYGRHCRECKRIHNRETKRRLRALSRAS